MRPPTELWNISAEVRPLPGGQRNLAFRSVGLARDVVFKTTRRGQAAMLWLADVQLIVRQAGFVVPEMIKSRDGQLVAQGWTCETYVEGTGFAPDEMGTILPLVQRFHDATADVPQRPGFLSSVALIDRASGGDVALNAMPTTLVDTCRQAWRAVADRRQAVIHGDLNPGNLIRCPDGRAAMIDWDECRRDLVLFDLCALQQGDRAESRARKAWEIACSWAIEPDCAKKIAAQM